MYIVTAGTIGVIKGVGQVVSLLLIFALILLLAYLSSKFAARWQSSTFRNNNIEIIETMRIDSNKLIQIVRIGDRYVALGIGKEEVTFLTELEKEAIQFRSSSGDNKKSITFKEIMDKVNEKKSSK